MTDPATSCAIGTRPHPAHDGLLVCRGHRQALSALLRDIEDEAIHLDTRPSMAVNYNRSGGGLASEVAPVRIEALAMLDGRTKAWAHDTSPTGRRPAAAKGFGPWCLFCDHDTCVAWRAGRRRDLHDDEHDAGSHRLNSVLGVLHTWANGVRESRHLQAPAAVTLTGERDLLTRHLPWIAEQPQVGAFHTQLSGMLAQLRRLNGTARVPAGTCSTLYDGTECGGRVWHVEIDHPGEDPEPGFRCGKCRRVWTGTAAVRLRVQLWVDEQTRNVPA